MRRGVAVVVFVSMLALAGCALPAPAPAAPTVSAASTVEACGDAMAEAAGVEELDNDAELVATTEACGSVDEWVAALQEHPGAGSLTSYTESDAHDLLGFACVEAGETPVCGDARSSGLIG